MGFNGGLMEFNGGFPWDLPNLVNVYSLLLKMAMEIVDLPMEKW